MPLLLIRNDITRILADAIVNPANEYLQEGSGTSRVIFQAAGEKELKEVCDQIGYCKVGQAVLTPGFELLAWSIIHAVVPMWQDGKSGEMNLLKQTYLAALELARKENMGSVAFPLLAAGNCGFPKDKALQAAMSAISEFLMQQDMTVYLTLYDQESLAVSQKLFSSVAEYIDDHYVEMQDESYPELSGRGRFQKNMAAPMQDCSMAAPMTQQLFETDGDKFQQILASESEYKTPETRVPEIEVSETRAPEIKTSEIRVPKIKTPETRVPEIKTSKTRVPEIRASENTLSESVASEDSVLEKPKAGKIKRVLSDLLKKKPETFSQMLLRLISEQGKTDAEVYRKANIDRRLFSKIRSHEDYVPTKKTVLAFAVALELSLDETKDLLMRAGYAFSNTSKFDVIIEFFIEEKQYDIFTINEMLFAYGQTILGA